MKFIDTTLIKVRAGHGGDGIVSFQSARGRPKMGPDGGDGGHGGHVFLVGHKSLNTLQRFRYKQLYHAQDGGKGGPNGRTGRGGNDLEIEVPLGTIVYDYDEETKICLGEILSPNDRLQVASGGKRGLGNIHWVSPRHQAPTEYKAGGTGEELMLRLELKLLSDVGLAGFPNAGKSTLLSRISAARPKIADYPFTTLVPNLGVVVADPDEYQDQVVVVADIPGLIEGASDGKGLGLQFLRHLERTNVIVFVLDGFDPELDPLTALEKLRRELQIYSPNLAAKRALVVVNKTDLIADDNQTSHLIDSIKAKGFEAIALSAIEGKGIKSFKRMLYGLVQEEKSEVNLAHERVGSCPQTI